MTKRSLGRPSTGTAATHASPDDLEWARAWVTRRIGFERMLRSFEDGHRVPADGRSARPS